MSYTRSTNYGLNVRLNVQCDFTNLILEQKSLFATAIAKQVAIDLLREIAFNATSRVNRHEANVTRGPYSMRSTATARAGPGDAQAIEEAIDAIQFDETGIDKHCLPCRRRAVKYRAV